MATLAGLLSVGPPGAVGQAAGQTADQTAGRPADAAGSEAPALVKKKLETRRNELIGAQDRQRALEQEVDDLRAEREKINALLIENAARVQQSEAEMTAMEAKLVALEADQKVVRDKLNERYGHISKLLSALQRMGRNPPPVMITRREDALQMVRSAMLLSTAFPGMKKQALELAGQLNELVAVTDKIVAERARLDTETKTHLETKIRLAGLQEEKKRSLGDRRAELEKVRVAATEISKNVEDLNGLFQKLEQVSRKTGADAYDQERKRTQPVPAAEPTDSPPAADGAVAAVSPPASGVPSGAAAPPAAVPPMIAAGEPSPKPSETAMLNLPPSSVSRPPMVELAPQGNSLVPGSPGRIKPSIAFQLAKAKLPLPAQGRRVLSFGDKTQYGGNSKGIVIETRSGAQVTSPSDGWIVYAGEFRSYGQLLIINAGGGYHVLMAGLSQIDVQPGQFVLAAEPVGTMTSVPKTSQASAQVAAPVLYVEFRKDGDPIDPDPWWVQNPQKALSEQKVQG
ncbi:MAG: murein hydrolase activator EnvC family protein [Hyphomicrobium sp.]